MLFISCQKFFLFLRYLHFYTFWLLERRLDKKVVVNFIIYDGTDWTKIILIHTLPNISRNKRNQAMKSDQLIYGNKYFSSKFMQKMR